MLEHSVISKNINQAQQNIETVNILTLGQKQDINSRLQWWKASGWKCCHWPIVLVLLFNIFAFRSRSHPWKTTSHCSSIAIIADWQKWRQMASQQQVLKWIYCLCNVLDWWHQWLSLPLTGRDQGGQGQWSGKPPINPHSCQSKAEGSG